MNTNKDEAEEKSIFGVFSPEEVKELHDEYKLNGNPNVALRKIATPLFRRYSLRSWDEGFGRGQGIHSDCLLEHPSCGGHKHKDEEQNN